MNTLSKSAFYKMSPICLNFESWRSEEKLREIFLKMREGKCLYNQLLSFGLMLSMNGAAEHWLKCPMES